MRRLLKKDHFKTYWHILLLLALFWTAMEVPLSYLVIKKGDHYSIIWDLLLSIFFTVNIYLNSKHEVSVRKLKQQFESTKSDINHNKIKKYFLPSINILSVLPVEVILDIFPDLIFGPHLRLLRLLRLIHIRDYVEVKNYLPKAFQIIMIIFGVTSAINAFACVWMLVSPAQNLTFWDEYNIAWYWAVTTLTTVGYGDIVPHNNLARIFTMFTMMMGVSSFALIIGNLSHLFMLRDRYKVERNNKMNSLQDLLNYYQIPSSVKREVSHFFHHMLEKKIAKDDLTLLKELPMPLQQEIQVYMKVKLMKDINIFKYSSDECLKMVAEKLDEKFFSPGQVIVEPGGESNEMYLISHGEVEITRNNFLVAQLKAGSIFGEMSLIQNMKRSALIVSKSYSDIFVLRKDAFTEISLKHPQLEKAFMDLYKARQYENSLANHKK